MDLTDGAVVGMSNGWTDWDEFFYVCSNGSLDDFKTQLDPVGGAAVGISLKAFPGRTSAGTASRYINSEDIIKAFKSLDMKKIADLHASARYLKCRGFDCLSTVNLTCINIPEDVKKIKNCEKGTIIARHSGDVMVFAWKDAKIVSMISTFYDNSTYMETRAARNERSPYV
ncbi:hypothetical protein EVAR_66710_1 [Eumeta japonica]|uniref:PiggyBac transposable element-derived protein domain-containing protein n=1 Tax=Eumeta variegata TaxID=151549 RepID=A0A4C1ZPK4_EUMVA|nr:hypothetical protein EVAR_66710_1 [Eumeta japonica]